MGLAVEDALGTTLEYSAPGSFDPIDDLVGGEPFGLRAGQGTDDTSIALRLAMSLLESGGFDPQDQMRRYLRWFRQGYLSSTGECFDIGGTTRKALVRFERTGEPYCGPTDPYSAGNGSLMRLAPVPMYFAGDAREAIDRSADSCRTTHGAVEAVDACRYFAGLLVARCEASTRRPCCPTTTTRSRARGMRPRSPPRSPLSPAGRSSPSSPPRSEGPATWWAPWRRCCGPSSTPRTSRRGALKVINLGKDADTTGAIHGQIAGTHCGVESIETSGCNDHVMALYSLVRAETLRGAEST